MMVCSGKKNPARLLEPDFKSPALRGTEETMSGPTNIPTLEAEITATMLPGEYP